AIGRVALFADGSVRQLMPQALDEKTRRALIDRSDSQKVDWTRVPVFSGNFMALNLNHESWNIVRQAQATPEQYRWRLRLSEKACQLRPENRNLLNTLGVAQYRVGRFREALLTLTQSNQLNIEQFKRSIPEDLAFLAMSHHQLGQREQALSDLGRLREIMK